MGGACPLSVSTDDFTYILRHQSGLGGDVQILTRYCMEKWVDEKMIKNNNNGEHLYCAFPHSSKRFDTHYYPDRPGINLKPSQLPWKYTVQLPVRRSD